MITVVNPTPPQGNSKPLEAKRLPWALCKDRRKKGLCYNCDKVYKPGHLCLKSNLLSFEGASGVTTMKELDQDDQDSGHNEGKLVTRHDNEYGLTSELDDKVILLSSLPEDIQVYIFLKLPVDSILTCRCVCKVWCSLLRSHQFIKTQLDHAKCMLMLKSLYFENNKCLFRSIDYASISTTSPRTCDWDVPWYHDFRHMDYESILMLGSCNGLICMSLNLLDNICIWNPSTGEYRKTPLPSGDFLMVEQLCEAGHVFYYDCIADDYKLVKIAEKRSSGHYQVDVYALDSKSWSLVSTTESINHYIFLYRTDISGSLVNGALHWIGFNNIMELSSRVIVSFDVRSERYVDIFFPNEVVRLIRNTYGQHDCTVGVLHNCLSLGIYYHHFRRIDVWLMTKYGVIESWTRGFSFSTTDIPVDTGVTHRFQTTNLIVHPQWKLLWCSANGELLIDTGIDKLFYDPKNNRFRALKIDNVHHIMSYSQSLNYVESLVSPNNIGF